MIEVKVKTERVDLLPALASFLAAGRDLRANISEPLELAPLERAIVPTGLSFSIPKGFEGQVRPRSGLAAKHGLTVLNAPGTIDADYRGEVGVILVNLSEQPYRVNDGDRIAQIVFAKVEAVTFARVDDLDTTERGAGSFGSTGV